MDNIVGVVEGWQRLKLFYDGLAMVSAMVLFLVVVVKYVVDEGLHGRLFVIKSSNSFGASPYDADTGVDLVTAVGSVGENNVEGPLAMVGPDKISDGGL